MSFLPAALAIGGSVVSAMGSISQGESALASAQGMKSAEDYNAAVLTQEADQIGRSAELDISRQRKAAGKLKSKQRALYGKAGVLLEGSPTEVIVDSAAEAEMDMQVTKYNADIEKRAKLSDAAYRSYLGSSYLEQGEQAQTMGYFRAGSTLLGAALDFSSKYGSKLTKKGV